MLCANMATNKLYTVRYHRKDLQQAILPHLDKVVDACFLKDIISDKAYTQVLKCDRAKQSDRFFLAIQYCIIRKEQKYDSFLQVLQEVLPHERSKDLVGKLNATLQAAQDRDQRSAFGEVPKSYSEPLLSPTKLHSRFTVSYSTSEVQNPLQEEPDDGDNGGLYFKNVLHSDSGTNFAGRDEQLPLPIQETTDEERVAERKEKLTVPIEESRDYENRPSGLKQRKHVEIQEGSDMHSHAALKGDKSGITTVLSWWQQASQECEQQKAQVLALTREVDTLRGQLTSAHEENEQLTIRLQKHLEEMESLRHEQSKQISALRERIQGNEELRVQIADVEADRHTLREQVHAITEEYDRKIKEHEVERDRLLGEIDRLCEKIPRLQDIIVVKEEIIERGKPGPSLCCQLYDWFCHALPCLIMLLLFLLALPAFLLL